MGRGFGGPPRGNSDWRETDKLVEDAPRNSTLPFLGELMEKLKNGKCRDPYTTIFVPKK